MSKCLYQIKALQTLSLLLIPITLILLFAFLATPKELYANECPWGIEFEGFLLATELAPPIHLLDSSIPTCRNSTGHSGGISFPVIWPKGSPISSPSPPPETPPETPTPLQIVPGLFEEYESTAWTTASYTEKNGKSVTREGSGLTIVGPTGTVSYKTNSGWRTTYRFFGSNNHLLILDTRQNVSAIDYHVTLIDFTTSPPEKRSLFTNTTLNITVPTPTVQYSKGTGDAFLIFAPTGMGIAHTAIYRSDNGSRLCTGPALFVPTGEIVGEATHTSVIIHYAKGGQQYRDTCSLDVSSNRSETVLSSDALLETSGQIVVQGQEALTEQELAVPTTFEPLTSLGQKLILQHANRCLNSTEYVGLMGVCSEAQIWTLLSGSTEQTYILSRESGQKCLAQINGNQLRLKPCDINSASQQFMIQETQNGQEVLIKAQSGGYLGIGGYGGDRAHIVFTEHNWLLVTP